MDEPGEPAIDEVDVEGMREYLAGEEVVFALLFGSHARGTADASSDVDVALRFPGEMDAHERFRRRNRIDAALQEYADGFVDVSDISSLPIPVAHAALRDGVRLVGDEQTIDEYRTQVQTEYESSSAARKADDEAFIERLARGEI
ncbi:Predicted nucleotidyltransferase [Halomicrobium zhouii]|uniref:Predicted nucleotidyltransferase n=1 Tax=Halomicrobium zhouii TaxID=767519 RepID=A0A1I6KGJ3_9EURY|nr:nucleotidyltransferase domain-containing protein [Halomicrobium zhouii]SFR90327.1 Predicted nucleotidyltransferase [Halomicrobium zhouii]